MKYLFLIGVILLSISACTPVQDNEHTPSKNTSITLENKYPLHENILTTFFWVGEGETVDNDYITNVESIWDEKWMESYGGVDDPHNRKGYFPPDFTPKENPFYFALPYSDTDFDGNRKSNANIVYWYNETDTSFSICKNRWIKIIKDNKIAYAQWEDVGPFEVDDHEYVFGSTQPKNEFNGVGLDVSPAARDYLNLEDMDYVDWQFIDFEDVPEGPWKTIITIS